MKLFGTKEKLQNIAGIKMVFFIVCDVLLIIISVFLAFLLRFDGRIPGQYFQGPLPIMIALALIFTLPVFYFFKLYFFSWLYVSTGELIALLEAATISFFLSGTTFLIFRGSPQFSGFPRSTLLVSYFLIFLLCGASRLSKRIYIQLFPAGKREEKERTLIVGAGDAGEQILRSIIGFPASHYFPVGFVDDGRFKKGIVIHGLNVLGKIEDIPKIVAQERINELIIALPSAGREAIKRAVGAGRKAGLKKIQIVPPITELINGQVSLGNIREIQVEDLLGREPVLLDTQEVANFLRGKKVLITGAAGSIGSELCRQVAKFEPSFLLMLDQDETGIFNISREIGEGFLRLQKDSFVVDIVDKEKMGNFFKNYQPNIVFHAAAYKHVPLMERQVDEAVRNNVLGTEIAANLAQKTGVEKFIFISTDKAVNPTSIMGATKRAGEMIGQVLNQKNNTKFISVRFGNVLDSRGSVIPIFREQIKKGGPVKVTHPEMRRYFMTTSEACLLVMQAGAMGQGGEVFVLDMGKPVKILDLAKEMIKLSGFEPDKDIPIVFSGVRPGEKLFEEMLTAEEGTLATEHQKIFKAKLSKINEQKLRNELGKLKKSVRGSDQEKIMNILKKLIPSYGQNKPNKPNKPN